MAKISNDSQLQNGSGTKTSISKDALSFLSGGNALYIDAQYARYLEDPNSVDAEWRAYFEAVDADDGDSTATGEPSWRRPDWPPTPNGEATAVFDGNWGVLKKASPKRSRSGHQRQAPKKSNRRRATVCAH